KAPAPATGRLKKPLLFRAPSGKNNGLASAAPTRESPMFRRTILSLALLLCATLPASAAILNPPVDPALASAAARMKVKDFAGAREAALKSSGNGARAFLLGMSCVRLEFWEEAAGQLAVAAESYPVLADY